MKKPGNSILAIMAAGVLTVSLAGCHKPGPAEQAGKAIDDAAQDTGAALDRAAENTGEHIEKAGDDIQRAAEDAKH